MESEEKLKVSPLAASKGKRLWQTFIDIVLFFLLAALFMTFFSLFFAVLFKGVNTEAYADNLHLLMLNEVFLMVSVFLASWLVLRMRKRPLSVLGLSLKGHGKDVLAGTLFAVGLYAVGFGLSLLLGAVRVVDAAFHCSFLLMSLMFFLLVGITEELAVRGFILGHLLDGGVNRFVALLLSSVIFSLLHVLNPNFAWIPFLNIVLAGVLLGASYIYTRNLCFPIALHWCWNWLQGPVLGYEVSGNSFGRGILTLRLPEANLINGGAFGFEGSILCSLLLVVGVWLIIRHYERRRA